MNYFKINNIKSIIWKESLEAIRRNRIYIPVTIFVAIFLEVFPVIQMISSENIEKEKINIALSLLPIYFPLIIIAMIGTNILARSLFEERIIKSLHILFASGISPKVIWTGKYITAVIFSYISIFLTFIFYYLFCKIFLGYSLVLTSQVIVLGLVTIPIISYGMLAVVGFAYWAFKNTQFITILFPILNMFGSTTIVSKAIVVYPLYSVSLFAGLYGIILLGLSVFFIGKLPKERITNI